MEGLRADYKELKLLSDNKVNFTVVIAADADKKVKAAAEDFCNIFSKMTGKTPDVVKDNKSVEGNLVLIGPSSYTKELGIPEFEQFPLGERVIVKRLEDKIILVGNDSGAFTGTQFAVTMFFERLGCGWFGPDELWHVIPETEQLSIGYLDIDHRPQFESRSTNVLKFNRDVGMRWYQGGVPKVIGHALTGLIPREEYFETKPEWFCLLEGKRNPFVEWWQYCYSNKELQETFIEKICKMFSDNPDMVQFSIAANDGWHHGWCECDKCQELGANNSERFLVFANEIAKGVAKEYPDHTLTLLAYFPTYQPPKRKMKMEPNVEIMFCKEADMFSPVDKGPDNGYHLKYEFPQSKNSYPTPWKENFEKWLENVDCEKIAIWDWYCIAAASPVWKDIPWVQGDVITRNQRFWYDHGVRYIYNDQGPLDVFYEDDDSYPLRWPLWYVNVKAMWDKDLTGSDILMDACKKLYEEAADLMFAFYNCLADIARNCTARSIAWHPPKPSQMYTSENIGRVDRILSLVKEQVPLLSEKVKQRISNQVKLWEKAKEIIKDN